MSQSFCVKDLIWRAIVLTATLVLLQEAHASRDSPSLDEDPRYRKELYGMNALPKRDGQHPRKLYMTASQNFVPKFQYDRLFDNIHDKEDRRAIFQAITSVPSEKRRLILSTLNQLGIGSMPPKFLKELIQLLSDVPGTCYDNLDKCIRIIRPNMRTAHDMQRLIKQIAIPTPDSSLAEILEAAPLFFRASMQSGDRISIVRNLALAYGPHFKRFVYYTLKFCKPSDEIDDIEEMMQTIYTTVTDNPSPSPFFKEVRELFLPQLSTQERAKIIHRFYKIKDTESRKTIATFMKRLIGYPMKTSLTGYVMSFIMKYLNQHNGPEQHLMIQVLEKLLHKNITNQDWVSLINTFWDKPVLDILRVTDYIDDLELRGHSGQVIAETIGALIKVPAAECSKMCRFLKPMLHPTIKGLEIRTLIETLAALPDDQTRRYVVDKLDPFLMKQLKSGDRASLLLHFSTIPFESLQGIFELTGDLLRSTYSLQDRINIPLLLYRFEPRQQRLINKYARQLMKTDFVDIWRIYEAICLLGPKRLKALVNSLTPLLRAPMANHERARLIRLWDDLDPKNRADIEIKMHQLMLFYPFMHEPSHIVMALSDTAESQRTPIIHFLEKIAHPRIRYMDGPMLSEIIKSLQYAPNLLGAENKRTELAVHLLTMPSKLYTSDIPVFLEVLYDLPDHLIPNFTSLYQNIFKRHAEHPKLLSHTLYALRDSPYESTLSAMHTYLHKLNPVCNMELILKVLGFTPASLHQTIFIYVNRIMYELTSSKAFMQFFLDLFSERQLKGHFVQQRVLDYWQQILAGTHEKAIEFLARSVNAYQATLDTTTPNRAQDVLALLQNPPEQNPYRIYKRLAYERAQPSTTPRQVQSDFFGQNYQLSTQALQSLGQSLAKIPATALPGATWHDFYVLLKRFQQRVHGRMTSSMEGLLEGITGHKSFTPLRQLVLMENHLRGLIEPPQPYFAPVAAKFTCIIAYLKHLRTSCLQTSPEPHGFFADEVTLLKFLSMVQTCKVGKNDGIHEFYKYVSPQFQILSLGKEDTSTLSGRTFILQQVLQYLERVLNTDLFLAKVSGQPITAINKQQIAHTTLYLKHAIGNEVGIPTPTLSFDVYAGIIDRDILIQSKEKLLASFWKYVDLGGLLKFIKNRVNQALGQQGIAFAQINALIQPQHYWRAWDETFQLTRFGALQLLTHLKVLIPTLQKGAKST